MARKLQGTARLRLAIDPVKNCFDCHTQVADRNYVFSQPLHVGELTNLALGGGGD